METKEFTLGEFFDAMEKNGYPKLQNGSYVYLNPDETVYAACAFGQAGLNLGIGEEIGRLHSAVLNAGQDAGVSALGQLIHDNDKTDMTIQEIAQKYRNLCKDILDETFEVWIGDYD